MIWFALAYLILVWALTFPATILRLRQAKSTQEYNAMIYLWESLPALILMAPALVLGYIVLWMTEQFLRGLVITARASWRAWLAIGKPVAEFCGWAVSKLLPEAQ